MSSEETEALRRELAIQKNLQHPHIVKMYNSFEKDGFLYIVLEFIENGNLFEYMNKRNMSISQILLFFRQITTAVAHLHEKNILHRDIKPENILIESDDYVKLCDFGFCAPYGGDVIRKTMCGTTEYLPPEILMGAVQNNKVDIWCLGVLLYELVHKRTPFDSRSNNRLLVDQNQQRIQFDEGLDEGIKELILGCLKVDPRERWTAEDILNCSVFGNDTGNSNNSKSKNDRHTIDNRNGDCVNKDDRSIEGKHVYDGGRNSAGNRNDDVNCLPNQRERNFKTEKRIDNRNFVVDNRNFKEQEIKENRVESFENKASLVTQVFKKKKTHKTQKTQKTFKKKKEPVSISQEKQKKTQKRKIQKKENSREIDKNRNHTKKEPFSTGKNFYVPSESVNPPKELIYSAVSFKKKKDPVITKLTNGVKKTVVRYSASRNSSNFNRKHTETSNSPGVIKVTRKQNIHNSVNSINSKNMVNSINSIKSINSKNTKNAKNQVNSINSKKEVHSTVQYKSDMPNFYLNKNIFSQNFKYVEHSKPANPAPVNLNSFNIYKKAEIKQNNNIYNYNNNGSMKKLVIGKGDFGGVVRRKSEVEPRKQYKYSYTHNRSGKQRVKKSSFHYSSKQSQETRSNKRVINLDEVTIDSRSNIRNGVGDGKRSNSLNKNYIGGSLNLRWVKK